MVFALMVYLQAVDLKKRGCPKNVIFVIFDIAKPLQWCQ